MIRNQAMPDVERTAITAVRSAFVAADNAGHAEAINGLLTDDVVILHPHCGIIEGRGAALTFMQKILDEVHAGFDKQASYSTLELKISGDLAYERGHFLQTLTAKDGGTVEQDEGMYLWIYEKGPDGSWKIARIAGAFSTAGHDEGR